MAINLSAFFNNIGGQGQVSSDNSVSSGQSGEVSKVPANNNTNGTLVQGGGSGMELLKNMLAGDTFSGKVIGMQNDNVLLSLADGNTVHAKLAPGSTISKGQTLTFMLESNNNNNISIKPLKMDEQLAVIINKALDAAMYPATEGNINIVRELLSLNMPVDVEMIGNMIKMSTKFPDTDISTIANLMKLNIPVTKENIMQYEAYKVYEHSILNEFNDMGDDLSQMFKALIDENTTAADVAAKAQNLNEFVKILYSDLEIDKSQAQSAFNGIIGKEGINMISDIILNASPAGSDSAKTPALEFVKLMQSGKLTTQEFLEFITEFIKDNPQIKEQMSHVFGSADFNSLINQMIDETLKIKPSAVGGEDGISGYYKRIRKTLEKAVEAGLKDESADALLKDMQQVKSNIDFMNDLNKNMTYFQMPVKFSESDANGELYVFTNKKALAAGTDNVSALLHLDMDNLGPVDIYVRLSGKNVSTNFCLESEEMLDFVYSNIDKLNLRLEALGYVCHFEMNISNDEKFNIINDIVEKDVSDFRTNQYILDVRA